MFLNCRQRYKKTMAVPISGCMVGGDKLKTPQTESLFAGLVYATYYNSVKYKLLQSTSVSLSDHVFRCVHVNLHTAILLANGFVFDRIRAS